MYFETKYPLQLQYFLRPTEVPFYQIIIIFIVIIDILKKIYDLMNCCNTLSSAQIPHSTAWTKLKKNDSLEKLVRFWFRLHFLSRISTTFPRSPYDE